MLTQSSSSEVQWTFNSTRSLTKASGSSVAFIQLLNNVKVAVVVGVGCGWIEQKT